MVATARISCLVVTLFLGFDVAATAPIEVVGLFKDRAFVKTKSGEQMLRVGETTAEGVTLIDADAGRAIVRYDGKRYTISLSGRVGTRFKAARKAQMTINGDQLGQYRVRGAINDQFVNFLVDTGASVVAMSSYQAADLGLAYTMTDEVGSVITAQGTAPAYFVILDKVSVGGIQAENVRGAVIEGRYPVEILLGMSFLKRVSLREDDGVLRLTQKY